MAILPKDSFASSREGRGEHARVLSRNGLPPYRVGKSIINLTLAAGPDPREPVVENPPNVSAERVLLYNPNEGLRIAKAAADAIAQGDPAIYQNIKPPQPLA